MKLRATLLYEPGCDSIREKCRIRKYASKNSKNCTLENVKKAASLIFGNHIKACEKWL